VLEKVEALVRVGEGGGEDVVAVSREGDDVEGIGAEESDAPRRRVR
jgi:hypothetical protein